MVQSAHSKLVEKNPAGFGELLKKNGFVIMTALGRGIKSATSL